MFTSFLEDTERRHRHVVEDRQSRRQMAKNCRSGVGAGSFGT
jgi:hypothetical protein